MRIVSGKFRGRKLTPPAGLPVRPTTDFAKEGLFNILNNLVDFEGLRVLDLFSGTGSITFEFLSRGAKEVTAIDASFRCVDYIRKTADSFGITNLRAVKADILSLLKRPSGRFDLIFADPPYDLEGLAGIPDLVMRSGLLADDGWFILEHGSRMDFSQHQNYDSHRHYGSVNFTFFRPGAKVTSA